MLNSNAITPLYEQLMNKLKEEIAAGVYKSGDKLPPELEMAKQNNVSVITARKAMNELAALGIVEKKQGKGTFVSVPKYGRDYTQIRGFSESVRAMGQTPGSKLLEHSLIAAEEDTLRSLGLPPGSQAVKIVRLRYVNGDPMAVETNLFSVKYSFLLDEPLEHSLFEVLRERANIKIEKSRKLIEICRATAQDAAILGLRKNDPLLLVRSTAYTADGAPVYVCSQLINGERFQLMV